MKDRLRNWKEKIEGKDSRKEAEHLTERRTDSGDEIRRESVGKKWMKRGWRELKKPQQKLKAH